MALATSATGCDHKSTSAEPSAAADAAPIDTSPYREAARRIIDAALKEHGAYSKLERLCDDIGHRLSGSAALERAVAWAAETLRDDGHENVRTEEVLVPRWVRGEESLRLLEPRRDTIAMLGLGGSVGTPGGGITAEVVVVADETGLEAVGRAARGKIVLFNNPMPPYDSEKGSGYSRAVRFRTRGASLAARHGAVACLIRSVTATSLRSPHTGAMRYEDDAPRRIPAAAISVEDAEMLARLAARGTRIVVRLDMAARDEGMAVSANVVAELRGRSHPGEIVLIGAHLDSWDVGQGAHDDGAGCAMVMEALNILRRLDLVPRRTIRVVLFTNEENGLAGGKQYAADHADELPRHAAAIEADSGGFRPLGFSVDFADPQAGARAAEQLGAILALLEPIGATAAQVGGSGADISPMRKAGVPLLGLNNEGSRYFDFHHSPADTLDKVDPVELSQATAAMAAVAYVLADMPGRLAE